MSEEAAPKNEDQTTGQQTPELHQVQAVGDARPAKDSEDHPNERQRRMTRFEAWQVFFGVCATLLGIGGYLILDRQTTLMTRQTELLSQQAEVTGKQTALMDDQNALMGLQNDLMNRQSTIMEQQTQIMEDDRQTNRAAQGAMVRGRIGFESVRQERDKEGSFEFTISWENMGTTNAVGSIGHVHLEELPNGPTLEQFIGEGHTTGRATVIAPRTTLNSVGLRKPESFFFGLETNKRRPINLTSRKIFLYGWRAYRDIFPNSKPRLTGLCHQLAGINIHAPANQPEQLEFVWIHCSNYNCVDDDCDGYESITAMLP